MPWHCAADRPGPTKICNNNNNNNGNNGNNSVKNTSQSSLHLITPTRYMALLHIHLKIEARSK